ncbi:tetratricopeptide repeat protein [Azospirillum agricola]|uniref:tetratricopeptide repeat-containing glycosyltransferase family protein n=1 Tax=Azospirillum agricola TaxID=1720247 RepID=UPI000A0F24BB|nr:tetratricopeptide repeat-containing glycosyltransferase family protein [Azospirillum agricola]SMH41071.1 Tetratricopeptide (TPR) repeat [Azospirillum lipoferum]
MPAPLDHVLQHFHAGRFTEAVDACRESLAAWPDDLGLLTILGIALHRSGRSEEAVAVFRDAVLRHPAEPDVLANLAILLQTAGRLVEAERCLHRLRAVQPHSVVAMQRLGVIEQSKGDVDLSACHLDRAARLSPLSAEALFNLGAIRSTLGFPDQAAAAFSALIAAEPGNAVGYVQQGATLLALGALDRAVCLFDRARRIDPSNSEARDGAARCLRYRVAVAASHHSGVPEGILIRGPYQGISGYAHMTNRLVGAMAADGVRVHTLGLLGNEPWAEPLDRVVRARSIVSCQTPPTVEIVPGLMTVNLTMFEGTRIPVPWRRLGERHDLIIVPTESSRIAWVEQGFPEDRLRVCPLGVDAEAAAGPAVSLTLPDGRPVLGFRHRFLNISDFIPRKNLDGVLRVWLTATTAADDAVLVLKLGKGGSGTSAAVEALFRQTEAIVGRRREEAAPILVVVGALDEASMTGLFRTATHYWSLSHGEGWDLPMSKAGAMGLQLVAPAHSSYVDYLDGRVARMIPSITGPAHLPNSRDPWPTFHGLDWWEPDEGAACQIISGIVRDEDVVRLDARGHLLARFTWAQASEKLQGILRETGAF